MQRFVLLSTLALSASAKEFCRILALSGGGDRGSYESGVIKGLLSEMDNTDLAWDVVTGASVGALNAATSVLFDVGKEQEWSDYLESLWFNVEKNKIYKSWPLGVAQGIFTKKGIFNSAPLQEFASNVIQKRSYGNRHISIVATDMTDGGIRLWDEKTNSKDLVEAVLASSAIPAFFPSVLIDGAYYNDGGCLHNIEIASAVNKCLDKGFLPPQIILDVISTSPIELNTDTKDLSKYHSIEMLLRNLQVQLLLSNARFIREAKETFKNMNFRFLIGPSAPLEGNRVSMEKKTIQNNFRTGLKDGKQIAKDYKNKMEQQNKLKADSETHEVITEQFETALVQMERAVQDIFYSPLKATEERIKKLEQNQIRI
eukprot:GDKJ01056035.1.p1 GENE.GDKJ01056035.1~~GDKJ01056035.1.p1  ORF type:complete len:371 (-),score=99.09 GDKJ01056035.1:379-1491(-)